MNGWAALLTAALSVFDLLLVFLLVRERRRLNAEEEAYDELYDWAERNEPYVLSQARVLLALEAASRFVVMVMDVDSSVADVEEQAVRYREAVDAIPRSAFTPRQKPSGSERTVVIEVQGSGGESSRDS